MRYPIFDGHNDTLLNLYVPERGQGRSFFERSDIGHIDLPRALEGGFAGGFFAMFTPQADPPKKPAADASPEALAAYVEALQTPVSQERARELTLGMMALLLRIASQSAGRVRVVHDVASLRQCIADGVMAAIMHIEGVEAIDPGLDALYVFYEAGLRSLGPVWSRPNAFGHGVPFAFPGTPDTGPGLTEAGKALVRACNDLGVLIDLSHLNEKGFWDVADRSAHPLIATHSGAHALCASPRNLTDRQLDAIRASGGVVGVNFHVGFLREDGRQEADTPLQRIADHAVYMADRMGIEHVALGSDFDGATMPAELGDVAGLPRLMDTLAANGFGPDDLQKIGYTNWIRVLEATWHG
ncbi:MAG: dipeptidase [Rhodothermales bacterium]